jgi:glycogenin glucosyltransferase
MASSEVMDVQVAEAVAVLPPRPDAIMTLLTTDDFLLGVQTLLYSVKKHLPANRSYPPELVVLVTPNISESTRHALHPAFCTRILQVDPIDFPESSNQLLASHIDSWQVQGGLTKLHIFRLENYDTILYLDADCLVVKDVSHLLDLGKVYTESEALIAASPDIFPPDKFNGGVLVVRPSRPVFDNMMAQSSLLSTYDGGDTGFLNAYYSNWYTEMPPMARLSFGYNAQRFMYHCTYEKQPNYWDMAVAPDLHVIHYSSSPKPWETMGKPKQEVQEHLGESEARKLRASKSAKTTELEALWRKTYQRSKTFAEKYRKAQEEQGATASALKTTATASKPASNGANTKVNVHKLIMKRYKELRSKGMSTSEAMGVARSQYGLDQTDNVPAASQVASLFGMM